MGRHSVNPPARSATAVIVSGAFAAVGLTSPGTAHADTVEPQAPPGGWDPVILCESGGNPRAVNPGSTASGLFQFLDSTWRSLGGTEYGARAKDATPAEQQEIADRAYSRSGLTPWAASRHCWAGRIGRGEQTPPPPAQRPSPAVVPSGPPAGEYLIRTGDTLSGIAAANGITWQELWATNRATVADPSRIYIGQRIRLTH